MSSNLLDSVKNYFSAEFINQAVSRWGESNAGITKGLSAIIPAGLAGIIHKATSGPDGENRIFEMAKDAAAGLPSSPNYNSLSGAAPTGNLLSNIFGGNHSGIVSMIARFAGIKESSVSSLMSLGLPVMLGMVGKHAQQNNLSSTGLAGFLSTQKDAVMRALPAGLSSMLPMLGLGTVGSAFSSASAAKPARASHADEDSNMPPGTKWLMLLILFVAGLALLWYFIKERDQTGAIVTVTDTTTISEPDTAVSTSSTGKTLPEAIMVKLPNGKELDAYKGGIEDQLVTFLKGDWKSMSDDALKAKWFDFDNLNFNTGNAILLPESQKQLENIAEILKAFPDAKIKIGGYTDASGDAAGNKKLSQDRADAARSGLVKLGVGPQVVSAEGYGSAFAKYPASASEEERAADRRVSVSVRK
jgi:outer membrane protein OmpA-like peptidoglycan-associated protein